MKYIGMVVILILLGAGLIFMANSQKSPPSHEMNMSGEPTAQVSDDKSFLEHMIPHHEEAVTSSEAILKVATTPEVKTLAEQIITAQKKEIAEMKQWYKAWFGKEYKDNGSYTPMMSAVSDKDAKQAEQTYLKEMIAHHEMAIISAKSILSVTKRAEIKTLGNNIVRTQSQEVTTIKDLLHETHN